MASVSPPGPLAEKYATTGAGLKSSTSSVGRMTAVGFLLSPSYVKHCSLYHRDQVLLIHALFVYKFVKQLFDHSFSLLGRVYVLKYLNSGIIPNF